MNFISTICCCCWIPNVAVVICDSHRCERQPYLPVRCKDRKAALPPLSAVAGHLWKPAGEVWVLPSRWHANDTEEGRVRHSFRRHTKSLYLGCSQAYDSDPSRGQLRNNVSRTQNTVFRGYGPRVPHWHQNFKKIWWICKNKQYLKSYLWSFSRGAVLKEQSKAVTGGEAGLLCSVREHLAERRAPGACRAELGWGNCTHFFKLVLQIHDLRQQGRDLLLVSEQLITLARQFFGHSGHLRVGFT